MSESQQYEYIATVNGQTIRCKEAVYLSYEHHHGKTLPVQWTKVAVASVKDPEATTI